MASRAPDLANIQGNVLVGFGKPCQDFLILTFAEARHARAWVAEIAAARAAATHVAFSHRGLRALGVPEGDLHLFPPWFPAGGMAARSRHIGDEGAAAPAQWAPPFEDGAKHVDALLIVAADDPAVLERLAAGICATSTFTRAIAKVGVVEGRERVDAPGCEHFGYRDGLSQPGIRGVTEPEPGQSMLWPGEFVLGYPAQIGQAKPGVAGPNPDPGPISASGPAWTIDGSYLVLRRLQQDVPGFDAQVQALAREAGLPVELVEAKLMGRYKSGRLLEDVQDGAAPDRRCPLGAHTRKCYPRDARVFAGAPDRASEIETHRLLRRAIPFGPSSDPSRPETVEQCRGLVFVAYQADIERQFDFVQNWMNFLMFPLGGGEGVSPGQDPIAATSRKGPFQLRENTPSRDIEHFVMLTGGEYFFSPSIAALHVLGAGAMSGS